MADALSRIPWPVKAISGSGTEDVCAVGEEEEEEFDEIDDLEEFEVEEAAEPLITMEQMLLAQRDDPSISIIKRWIEENETPTKDQIQANPPDMRAFFQLLPNLEIDQELVVLRDEGILDPRILVPESLIDRLIEVTHEGPMSAHEGPKKVL